MEAEQTQNKAQKNAIFNVFNLYTTHIVLVLLLSFLLTVIKGHSGVKMSVIAIISAGILYLTNKGWGKIQKTEVLKINKKYANTTKHSYDNLFIKGVVLVGLILAANLFNAILTNTIINILGLVRTQSVSNLLPQMTVVRLIYAIIIAPVCEEIIYRGIIYSHARKVSARFAIIITSILFLLMHGNIPQIMGIIFPTIIFGVVREYHGLAAAIGVHISNNIGAFIFTLMVTYGAEYTDVITVIGIILVALMVFSIVYLLAHYLYQEDDEIDAEQTTKKVSLKFSDFVKQPLVYIAFILSLLLLIMMN